MWIVAVPVWANRDTDLQQLRQRIGQLQTELEETRGERDTARERLRDTERRIGDLIRALHDSDAGIRRQTLRLRELEAARAQTLREQSRQREELEQSIRAAYVLGRQDTLKLLLSQDDPARAARMLTYYRYLSAARATKIDDLSNVLARLQQLQAEIRDRQQQLTTLKASQLRDKQSLEALRAERRATLAQLDTRVRNRSQEIERLRRDEERLTRLVRGLGAATRPSPAPAGPDRTPPLTGRGKWHLPVRGHLAARFGQVKAPGELRWRGLFLATAEGQPVRAVAAGQVVYADWLRGFGLLLVLDHGHGLMTLYGHNQSLYKGVGDPVEPGETIALSGNTGGPPEPGLYFEVRDHGEPRDPLDWCKL